MKLVLLCVGKTRERFIQEGIKKYLRYLKPYTDIEIKELKEEKIQDLKDAPFIRKREADRIIKAAPVRSFLAALDERGHEFTSHEFAQFMQDNLDGGVREMAFVIGGALGLDESITERANRVIALSRWTITHEMAKLVLLEQLYRAFTIIKGKKYHY
jgi:23S rRNA (pseudouridine1915-N3)-methyltransferase